MVEAVHHCPELSFIVLVGVLFNLSPGNVLNHEQHIFIEFQRRIFLFCQLLDTPAVVKDSDVVHIDNQQSVINPPGLRQEHLPTLSKAVQWPMLIHRYFVDFSGRVQLIEFESLFDQSE